jgi:HSP20 family protein
MIKNLLPWKKHKEEKNDSNGNENPFELMHRQMNSLFDGFFNDFQPEKWLADDWDGKLLCPNFEVDETDKEIKVSAELPGMDEKDIDVTLDGNVLTIKGEKKEEKDEKTKGRHISERMYGSFRRNFSLPENLDKDNIKAGLKKGVLEILLPKTEEAKSKKIELKS